MSDAIERIANNAREEFAGGVLYGVPVDLNSIDHILALAWLYKTRVESQSETIHKLGDLQRFGRV